LLSLLPPEAAFDTEMDDLTEEFDGWDPPARRASDESECVFWSEEDALPPLTSDE
jgi:hypothetical protein